jgi:glutamyl/glutaminyl-tRNA synthetase
MRTLADGRELLSYLWTQPEQPSLGGDEKERLAEAIAALRTVDWSPEAIEPALETLRESRGWSRNQLFKPIRQAVTGGNSPPIHHTLALLPRDEAIARMERAL